MPSLCVISTRPKHFHLMWSKYYCTIVYVIYMMQVSEQPFQIYWNSGQHSRAELQDVTQHNPNIKEYTKGFFRTLVYSLKFYSVFCLHEIIWRNFSPLYTHQIGIWEIDFFLRDRSDIAICYINSSRALREWSRVFIIRQLLTISVWFVDH